VKVLHSALKGETIVLNRALDSSDALVGSVVPSEEAYFNLQNGEAWTEIDAESAEALQNDLKTKEKQERVFTLFLPLFDSSLTQGCRTAIAGEIEDTLASDNHAILLSSQRFHAAVFPQPSRLDEALLIAGNAKCGKLAAFLRILSRRQPLIAEAVAAWSQMPSSALPDRLDSEAARSLLIQAGTFLRLVESNAIGRFSQDFLRSELRNPQVLKIPNIENWLYKFLQPFFWKEREQELDPHDFQAYIEHLDGWKKTIMELVQTRPEGARQAAMVLKNEQLTKGHARFAAMTLCDLAKQCKAQGRFKSQLAMAELAVRANPHDPQCHCQYADAQKGNGLLQMALITYQATIAESPDAVFAGCGKAEVLREMNRLPEALACYEETIAKFLSNVVARNGKAEVLRELNSSIEALACYEETIAKFPSNVVARNGKAEVLRELNRLPEALTCYEETIAEFPEDVFARCGKAEVLRELNRLPEALTCYEETIAKFAEAVFARCGKAEVLRELNRLPEALACYEETIAKFPEAVVARNGKAGILARLGRIDDALALLPEDPSSTQDWVGYHIRGMILLRMGDTDLAATIFEHGCRSGLPKKQSDFFRTSLALCHIKRQEATKALQILPSRATGKLRTLVPLLTAHALGENEDRLGCEQEVSGIISHGRKYYLEAAQEIFARYVQGAPKQSKEWLYEHEMELALAA
jgi:tetratricopeptide (TPR) repeat protein